MARQLVIELVGKADKYTKTLGEAEKASASFGDKIEGAGKKMSAFVTVPIVGFLGAATKAAMDDAAAQAHLAQALQNSVGANKDVVAGVEDYLTKMMKVTTFSDDDLRPAFAEIVRATQDVGKAQDVMAIAMDVAAGKGISLETAALAVTKASEGQFAAVNKLVPGLIDMKDKTLTADDAMAQLVATFDGSAIAATETTAGKMQILKRDLGEASEAMGAKLLPVLTGFADFATTKLLPVLDSLSGGNGAFVLLGLAAVGPVLSHINTLRTAILGLNLTLDATAVKAAAALGAIGIVIQGINTIKNTEGGIVEKVLGPSGFSRFIQDLLPGKAAGGPVRGGSAYLVGERGPELFVPGASGGIVPNHAMGGVTVNVAGSVITERDLGRIVADALRNNSLIGVT